MSRRTGALYYSYMKTRLLLTALITATPSLTFAQIGNASLQSFFGNLLLFINSTLIPFLFGLAFLLFAFNVVKYFVVGGSNKDAREDAKNVALYSVAAFVFLIIFWGLVNMFSESVGLENCGQVQSDYVQYNFMGPSLPNCP